MTGHPFSGSGSLAILGGAGGIGRVLVREAAALGYDLIVIDLPASLRAHPPSVPAYEVDATSLPQLDAAARALPGDLAGLVSLSGSCGKTRS